MKVIITESEIKSGKINKMKVRKGASDKIRTNTEIYNSFVPLINSDKDRRGRDVEFVYNSDGQLSTWKYYRPGSVTAYREIPTEILRAIEN